MNTYQEKIRQQAPELLMENKTIMAAYEAALKNLLDINTVACPAESYNRTGLLDEKLGLMIRAGGEYPTPWTRDAAINTMNAACFLEPEVAKNTLWAVCERVDGKLCFQMDNQSWDKIVWATGAWKYYLATKDEEFLPLAYETVENSLCILEKTQFNEKYGLFTGGSFFNDGITGYPADLHEEGNGSSFMGDHPAVKEIMTLSTNCLYYNAYRILEKMARLLGKDGQIPGYQKKGDALKAAINRNFWEEDRGTYAYILYPDGRVDASQEGCGLSFAILMDVCTKEQAVRILENCVRSERGIVTIWPPFAGISSVEKPLRHNNLIWPFVNGFFATAAAKYGFAEIVGDEIQNMAALAVQENGHFSEIYNPRTGLPDGGWQVGHQWGSVKDQTWSATGFIRSLVFGVFGIELGEEEITFCPCLPKDFGTAAMKGIRFGGIELDVEISGAGSRIASMTVNGEKADRISFAEPGKYRVEILMEQ